MRKVLITGATSGFGQLMVKEFLKNGDFVIATGRNLTSRNHLFETERAKYSQSFRELNLDITDHLQIQSVTEEIKQLGGTLDVLVNNAGHGLFGALEDLNSDEIRHQMEVNFFGLVEVTRSLLPFLRRSKGKIFNFSSVFGLMGFPLTGLYCASKYAVEGLSESLRIELSSLGVQVCLIEPGGYRTDFSQNLKWSDQHPDSVYSKQMKNYQNLHEHFSKKKTQEPIEVAQGVLKLSLRSKLPMRRVFGVDGKFSYVLKTILPEFIYFPLMEFILGKVLSKS
jgi:short-subunit dehydrogenase